MRFIKLSVVGAIVLTTHRDDLEVRGSSDVTIARGGCWIV